MRLLLSVFLLCLFAGQARAQCAACEVDPDCVSADGFPTICPSSLPAGVAGEAYEAFITFYIPQEIADPGSGLVATLLSVTVTGVAGLPPGIDFELDDADGVYEPASGQTSGCATLCGTPAFAGVFNLQINITAVVTALGFEQTVSDGFSLALVIEPGAGGTSSFTYSPAAGCGEVVADFTATVFGEGNQWTEHTWTLPDGSSATGSELTGIVFDAPGPNAVGLETVILNQVLQEVQLNATGGGGWDDFFGNPDPYFTLKDANDNVIYTSGTVDDVGSATWSGLSIILDNPPYALDFYDEDLFDGDDWLGWAPFTPNGPGTLPFNASPSVGQLVIGLQPLVTVVDVAEIEVFALPEPAIGPLGDDALQCAPDTLLSYAWYLDGYPVAEGADATFTPEVSGWYSVMAMDANGCQGMSDSILFCLPDAGMDLALIEFNGTPMGLETSANHPWWLWSVNGVPADTLFAGGQVWFPLESGWYAVESVSADLGCPLTSDPVLVCWPLDAPNVIQDAAGDLVVEGTFATYQWWAEGVPMAGQTGPVLTAPGEGIYTVQVTDFSDCPAVESAPLTYVGVAPGIQARSLRVYPNPVEHRLHLEVEPRWWGGQAALTDMEGRVIGQRRLEAHMVWEVSHLPTGTYLLRCTDASGQSSEVRRIVRQ